MQLFLATPEGPPQTAKTLRLDATETHHATRVLRHSLGDELHAVDGAGMYYRGPLTAIHPKAEWAELTVTEHLAEWGEPPHPKGVIISLLKARDRFEWFLEKAVELGVTHVYPSLCQRTVGKGWKPERAQKILQAGLKQNLRSRLPHCTAPRPLTDWLTDPELHARFPNRYIPYCGPLPNAGSPTQQPEAPAVAPPLKPYFRAVHPPRDPDGQLTAPVLYAIGPEGDFTEKEVHTALAHGYQPVSLGPTRLRAETAGLVVVG